MACAKLSAACLFNRVVPQSPRPPRIMFLAIGAWAVFSLFAIAFQCQLPTPWIFIPSQCRTHGYLQYPIIIFNIITDLFLAIWILPIVWSLNMTLQKRMTISVLFGFRVIVPIAAIGQLWSLTKVLQSSDQTCMYFRQLEKCPR
jgi:hypothetical protein